MNIAQYCIDKKTLTLVATAILFFGGIKSYLGLGRLEDPEFTIKEAQVFTAYPGATAMEVSEEVTEVLESTIQQMGQLKRVESISEPGVSTIKVVIKDRFMSADLPQVWDELRRKVNDVQGQLPPGTSRSIVNDDFGDVYGIFGAIYGDGYSYRELKEYAKKLRREFLLCEDVGKVILFADQQETIFLEVSRERLAQLQIPPDYIKNTLSGQNLVIESGNVHVGERYLRIQPSGEFTSVEDIGDLFLLQNDGTPTRVRIRDIGTLTRGYEDPPSRIVRFNGRKAIGLGISTVGGGNVVTMGNAVEKRWRELKAQTPIGMEFGPIWIQNKIVTTSINNFLVSLAQALAIVIGILMFAMGLRSGLLIGAILLLTVLGTFILMDINGVMLERISLGALIIALGMLVDNAIVVVEGILVNLQKGMDRVKAATSIVQQTMWPLFGATVVAVLAFAAIGTSQDSTGEFCRSLFQVILYSLFLSWLLAITITPLFGVMFLKVPAKKPGLDADPYKGVFFQGYKKFLVMCMNRRWATLGVLVAMLVMATFGFGFVKQSFFPPSTSPKFLLHYWMPQGTHINKTDQDIKDISENILKIDGVTNVSTVAGGGSLRFILTLKPEEANSAYGLAIVGVEDFNEIDRIRDEAQAYINLNYPGAQAFSRRFVLGPGEPQKIHARLRGPDPDILRRLSVHVKNIMEADGNAIDILDDWRQRVPMVRPIIAEKQARNAGVTRAQIAWTLQTMTEGNQVGNYREADEIIPIVNRAPKSERSNVANLKFAQIWSPVAQKSIPISQMVLGFESVSENSIVRRRNRVPTLTVKCDPAVGEASPLQARLMTTVGTRFNEFITKNNLEGYSLEWGGEFENSNDAQAGLAKMIPVIVLLMVFSVIALFNSLRLPAIIFLTVPLSIIGVTLGLLLMSQPFGFMALLGFMSLAGMLIKNAIVLIDEINLQMTLTDDKFKAVVDSGVSRLRPVSMAALTTVLGMIPLLADAFYISMAATVMFGLAFATVLTLIVVPVLYAIFFKIPSQK